ncbi:MAG: phosphonate ABC transporter, permease protein PhnE, partial [Pseudonocardiaceae bacterium]
APALVATALHRFDINLRISVVLGFVGVGGIGFEIAQSLRRLDYPRAMALALIVVLLCVAVELISAAIRRALLGGPTAQRRRPRRMPQQQHHHRAVEPGRISPPWDAARIRRAGFLALAVAIVIASVWEAEISPTQIADGLRDIGTTAGLFWPPETGGIGGELFDELLVTIEIALAGTLIGAVLALPVGAMAARNVAPSPRVARVFRIFVVSVRGIPELILAIVLVVITGLGAVAGACALGIGAMGLLGKLVADSLEETDTRVQLALRATGASRIQVFFAATLPQAAPAFVAHILYQLDVNIRAATLLGIVGAGGIGFYLLNASRVLEFGVVTTVMLMVFATVLAVELLALWLRRVVS